MVSKCRLNHFLQSTAMKKVNTKLLSGSALCWAVAKASDRMLAPFDEAVIRYNNVYLQVNGCTMPHPFDPDTNWDIAGKHIESECISIVNAKNDGVWSAYPYHEDTKVSLSMGKSGPTPLVAAMRCFVATKLGEEVEIPEELA